MELPLRLRSSAAGALTQDDAALTITMGDGTIGFSMKVHYIKLSMGSRCVRHRFRLAGTMTINYGNDVDSEANIQYHTPADVLPFGLSAKVGYVPNVGDQTGGNDFKNTGAINPVVEGVTN